MALGQGIELLRNTLGRCSEKRRTSLRLKLRGGGSEKRCGGRLGQRHRARTRKGLGKPIPELNVLHGYIYSHCFTYHTGLDRKGFQRNRDGFQEVPDFGLGQDETN